MCDNDGAQVETLWSNEVTFSNLTSSNFTVFPLQCYSVVVCVNVWGFLITCTFVHYNYFTVRKMTLETCTWCELKSLDYNISGRNSIKNKRKRNKNQPWCRPWPQGYFCNKLSFERKTKVVFCMFFFCCCFFDCIVCMVFKNLQFSYGFLFIQVHCLSLPSKTTRLQKILLFVASLS